jgi:hypothetical protein
MSKCCNALKEFLNIYHLHKYHFYFFTFTIHKLKHNNETECLRLDHSSLLVGTPIIVGLTVAV